LNSIELYLYSQSRNKVVRYNYGIAAAHLAELGSLVSKRFN